MYCVKSIHANVLIFVSICCEYIFQYFKYNLWSIYEKIQNGGQDGRQNYIFLGVFTLHCEECIHKNHTCYMINISFYIPKVLYKCVDYEIVCCSCHVWGLTSLFKMASKMAAVKMKNLNYAFFTNMSNRSRQTQLFCDY